MLRHNFRQELEQLQNQLVDLGSLVESALTDSAESLRTQDLDWARRLIEQDRLVNQKRFDIEEGVLVLIATQQPMATDLRTLAAMLEVVGELERVGDYAKGIAKITLMLGPAPLIKPLVDIPRMASKARDMLHRALLAFAERDVEQARRIPPEDDEVDDLYNQVYRELMTFIITDPSTLEQANFLLWAAHNLERAADRVNNICERVIFMVTGTMSELGSHSSS
ncbi:MAG: phosphate signaling complex protein PhoU [Anaerolineae bacterium]